MAAEEKKKFDIQEWVDVVNGLDFENIGGWPMPVKVVAALLVLVLVIGGGYMLNITELNDDLNRLKNEESSLMQQYESKAFKAKNLDQYKEQLAEMQEQFGALLEQLPKDTEVPGLLEDITHTGEGSGLEINKIGLKSEVQQQFYAELPIEIEVVGDYHGLGNFVSGVAALPRIVTLHDFEIKGTTGASLGGLLTMNITAETYRYVGGAK